jgi:hypothetical protein
MDYTIIIEYKQRDLNMLKNIIKSLWKSFISKSWHWKPILACILLYVILGMFDIVPWYDTTSIPVHISKAKIAMQKEDYSNATRHIIAVMNRVEMYPQYDNQCWPNFRS